MLGTARWWRLAGILLVLLVPALFLVLFPPFDEAPPVAPPDVGLPPPPTVEATEHATVPTPPGRIEGRVTRAGRSVLAELSLILHARHPGGGTLTATADGTGEFSIPGVPPGVHRITALGSDGVRISRIVKLLAPLTRASIDLALPAGEHTLRGRAVYADGRPFLGTVEVRGKSHADRIQTDTGPDGRFVLAGLEPGTVHPVFTTGLAFSARGAKVPIPSPDEILVVVDEGARNVRGRVLALGTDRPIEGAVVIVGGSTDRDRYSSMRVATDAEGRFTARVPTLKDRLDFLEVEADGFWVADLGEPAWREEFVIRLDRATQLTVRAVSAHDGRPVPSVPVTVSYEWMPDVPDEETTLTGADGRAVFTKIPGRVAWLSAKGHGWRMDHATLPEERRFLYLEPGSSREVDLPVHRAGLLIVTVTSASGEALTAMNLDWTVGSAGGTLATPFDKFTLPDLIPGRFTLKARKGGLSSPPLRGAVAPGEVRRVSLSLPVGAWADIEVRAEDTGAPIPGAKVVLTRAQLSAKTDAKGRARMGPFAAAPQKIAAAAGGYRSVAKKPTFEAGTVTAVEFVLPRGLSISGRALLPDGRPASSGNVTWYTAGPGSQRAKLAKDGTFVLGGLPPGTVRIYAAAKSSTGRSLTCLRAVHGGETGIVLRLEPRDQRVMRSVDLVVTDSTGSPVPRADFIMEGRDEEGYVVLDEGGEIADGRARIAIPVSAVDLRICVYGARRPTGSPLPLGTAHLGPVSSAPETFRIVLPPAQEITGRVLSPKGRGLARVQIDAGIRPWKGADLLGEYPWSVWSGPDGSFRIGGFGPGPVELVCYEWEDMRQTAPLIVAAGERDVVIRMADLIEATLTVRDTDGRPVYGVEVTATTEAGLTYPEEGPWYSPNAFGYTGADGTVRLRELARGVPYRVTLRPDHDDENLAAARIDGWLPGDRDVVLVAGRSVAGRLVRPEGTEVNDLDGSLLGWGRARGWVDLDVREDGTFRANGFGAGRVAILWMPHDDYSSTWEDVEEPDPETLPWPVTWVDAGDEKIEFRVSPPR